MKEKNYWCKCVTCGEHFTGYKRDMFCPRHESEGLDMVKLRDFGATHKHMKTGGFYRVLRHGIIEKTLEPAVIYEGQDGVVWVRPMEEFYDGRFVAV